MAVNLADVEWAARRLAHACAGTPDETPVTKGEGEVPECAVLKAVEEERYLLLVAYPAWKADVTKGLDGMRDFGSDKVIAHAAWSFMRKGAKLGLFHEEGYEAAAECVESYLWPCDEPWVMKAADGTTQTVNKGDWLIAAKLTPPAWALYKAGIIGGASVQGKAARRVPSAESLAQLRK